MHCTYAERFACVVCHKYNLIMVCYYCVHCCLVALKHIHIYVCAHSYWLIPSLLFFFPLSLLLFSFILVLYHFLNMLSIGRILLFWPLFLLLALLFLYVMSKNSFCCFCHFKKCPRFDFRPNILHLLIAMLPFSICSSEIICRMCDKA